VRAAVHLDVEPGTKWAHPAAHVHQWRERTWRNWGTCQFETVISAGDWSAKYADRRVEEVTALGFAAEESALPSAEVEVVA